MQPPRRQPPPSLTIEIAGWCGTAAILAAYALSSFAVIEQGRLYQLLNLTGALGVALICWRKKTWQAFWLEVVWGIVAIVALVKLVCG